MKRLPDPKEIDARRLLVELWTKERIKNTRELQRRLTDAGYPYGLRWVQKEARAILDRVIDWDEEDIRAEREFQLVQLDREIENAEQVKREAWAAWEKSKQERAEAKIKTALVQDYDDDGMPVTRQVPKEQEHKRVQQSGDPRYLKAALEASGTVRELLADKRVLLNMDVYKIAFTDPTGMQAFDPDAFKDMPTDELASLVNEFAAHIAPSTTP